MKQDRQEARAEGKEEGLREGCKKGQTEEREQGIRKMIELCQELAMTQEDTASKVAGKYQLEPKDISVYMEQYWND